MNAVLNAVKCPECPKKNQSLKPAMLFKAAGEAVIEIRCPRCGSIVTIAINESMNHEQAKQNFVAAND